MGKGGENGAPAPTRGARRSGKLRRVVRLREVLPRLRARWPEVVVVAIALACLGSVYFAHDYDNHEGLPRGTGAYRPLLATADGHKIYLSVRSLVFDRDLDLDNDIARFRYAGGARTAPDGDTYFPHGLGPVLVWAPVLAAAEGAATIGRARGADIPDHGYGLFHQRIVLFTSLLFAIGAALFGRSLARLAGCSRFASMLAAVGVLFGTSIYFYATYQTSYAHAMGAFFDGLFLLVWARRLGDLRWRRFAVLGTLLGAASLIRIASLALGVALAVELLVLLARRRTLRDLGALAGRGLACLGVALLVLVPQMLLWKAQTGAYLGSPNGSGYVSLSKPMVTELLFSSVNGFFSTHPLAYLGSLGLLFVPRERRLLAGGLLAALALQVYVNSCVYDWWGMGSFGARRLVGVTAILVVGLAALGRAGGLLLARARVPGPWQQALGVAVVAWFVLWNEHFAVAYVDREVLKIQPHATCCDTAPEWMQDLAEPVYDEVGNPFTWPASLLFAWRHDLPVEQWDVAVGAYAARPKFRELRSGAWKTQGYYWNIPGVNFTPYLAGGFGPRQRGTKNYRFTVAREARFLLPLFLDVPHWLSIPMRSPAGPTEVSVRMNGEEVLGPTTVGVDWQNVELTVSPAVVERGTNVVTIVSEPRPFARPPSDRIKPHPDGADVGVAVGGMRLKVLALDR